MKLVNGIKFCDETPNAFIKIIIENIGKKVSATYNDVKCKTIARGVITAENGKMPRLLSRKNQKDAPRLCEVAILELFDEHGELIYDNTRHSFHQI